MGRHDHSDRPPAESPWGIAAVKGILTGSGIFAGARLLRRSGMWAAAPRQHDAAAGVAGAALCTFLGAGQEAERQRADKAGFLLAELLKGDAKVMPRPTHADRIQQERQDLPDKGTSVARVGR